MSHSAFSLSLYNAEAYNLGQYIADYDSLS